MPGCVCLPILLVKPANFHQVLWPYGLWQGNFTPPKYMRVHFFEVYIMLGFIQKLTYKRMLYARVFLTVLVFIGMISGCYLFMNNIVHKHLIQSTKNTLDYAQYQVDAILLESEITLDGFARTLRNMIIQGEDAGKLQLYINDLSEYLSAKGKYTSSIKGFYGYFETLPGGPVFLSGFKLALPDDYNPVQSKWYQDAVAANGKSVEILVNEEIGVEETIITYAVCLFDDDGSRLGVVCIDVIFDGIAGNLAKTAMEINGIGLLISSNLTIIFHNNPDFISQPLRNPEIPASILADELEKGGEIIERPLVDYLGQSSVAFIRPIQNGWYLGFVIPKGPYYENVTRMTMALIILGALSAAVLIFILIRTDSAYENTLLLLNMNPLSVQLWSRDNNIIDCNDESVRLFGLESKSEIMERFFDLSPKYQPDGQLSSVKSAKCNQEAFNNGKCVFEWMHKKLDDTPIPVEVTLIRIPYKKDFILAGYARDLREHKKMMAEIREASHKLALETSTITTIFNLAPDHIFCKDLDLKYTRCNESLLKFFDIKMENIIGRDDLEGLGLPEKIAENYRAVDQKIISERKIYTNEEYVPAQDGSMRVFETSKVPLVQDGEITGLMGISRDITLRKAMEEAAKSANKAKSVFLANMSHEIRTPLNAILGIAEMQLHDEKLADNEKEALNMIYYSGELLLGIINDLLDMSKIEAGKFELMFVKYEIASLINDTMMLNMTRLGSKAIEFKLFVEDSIPTTLLGDELRIKQILNNLLSNAFKYTKSGTIQFSAFAEQNNGPDSDDITLVFKVADTGIGMSEEQINKLFDEYARFNIEANRTTQGTGLGMSITRQLLNMMNGEISVVSKVDEGSVFTIKIPQKKLSPAVLGKELVENLQMFRINGMKQLRKSQIVIEPMPYGRILIVDDVESNVYVAKGLMKPYRLNIDSVMSGYDVIDKINAGVTYDIIFMDHMMPNMDGIETTRIIRNMGYDLPIVALTANAVVGQADIFLKNGFDGFLSKPIDMRELNIVLKKFIRDKHPSSAILVADQGADLGTDLADDLASDLVNGERASEVVNKGIAPELAEVFLRDASKALTALEAVCKNFPTCTASELQTYVIFIHGMKSSLANVGEAELSALAFRLEQAGRIQNMAVMEAETPKFISRLQALTAAFKQAENGRLGGWAAETHGIIAEDALYLHNKMLVIQQACLDYDPKTAQEGIVELRQKKWPDSINDDIRAIAEHLLHSDFEDALCIIEKLKNIS